MSRRNRHVRSFLVALILGMASLCACTSTALAISVNEWQPPIAPASAGQLTANMTALDAQVLSHFMSDPAPGRHLRGAVWANPNASVCWDCFDAAGTAAAILYQQQGATNPGLYRAAVATFNQAIATNQQANGSFVGSAARNGETTTEFLLFQLGETYLELQSHLDSATKLRWSSAVARATDYLIKAGDTTWYANGNIQLRLAADLWMAWKITGNGAYGTAYENEWQFTMNPPSTRWIGFGLRITKAPTLADGSDGSGYLAESGGGAPGFDAWYTTVQLDAATTMWVMTRDPRWLRLANLLQNQLQPRVDSTATLDATGGTRKTLLSPYYTAAPQILYADGKRPDLGLQATVQQWRLIWEFTNTTHYDIPNFYEGLSTWVSVLLLDRQWPSGVTRGTPSGPNAARTAQAVRRAKSSRRRPRTSRHGTQRRSSR